MFDISNVDKNFRIETEFQKEDIKFYNADEEPFGIHGVFRENGKYRRIPESVAKTVNEGVYVLHTNTAGGRIRFATDSSYVSIHTKMDGLGKMPHFAFTGSIGFDLYADGVYVSTYRPPMDVEDGFEGIIEFGTNQMREITINMPLYSNVCQLYIGLQDSATVKEAKPYKNTKPVVYYGSSITQGGCASRPGMGYEAIVSRRLDCDFVNLGFSGSARAEDEIAEYIKNLDMSLFVYDYDHNSPDVEHLKNTHEKMFKTIRKAQPNLPVIMMSRPKAMLTDEEQQRRQIVEATYKNAISAGDKNVYFIDGTALTALCGSEGTVDNCHPTDLGFYAMADTLCKVMKNIDLE